jgi:hypothetical protein
VACEQRIADLEDLCRRKDSIIFDLKQEILALEAKVFYTHDKTWKMSRLH